MITVMFSCFNGGGDLRRMLDSMVRLQSPPGGWQLIAVDNASTDGSGDVMRSYADRLPITVLYEPRKGKTLALNRALELAKGDFYIFTDDDVIAPKDWLVKWRDVADTLPGYDLFAGRINPLWPHEPPRQLLSSVNVNVLYASHEGVQERPCSAACMHGPNMALRAAALKDGVDFEAGIGPDGSPSYAMGSDTELALRLEARGLKCWFTAGAFLEHIVPPEHLEIPWILKRGYRWGRGLAHMHLPYPCSPESLARKNGLKRIIYPVFLPLLTRKIRLQRQWQAAVDRGYEDGTRENEGCKTRWA
jgi:cellulose synthase/poly-beta-1,6-N-acetylglucosamine synthase-like glycosyltransferase